MISSLARKIADFVVGSNEADTIRYAKIKYISEVIISELSKLFILGTISIIIGHFKEYVFFVFFLVFTRRYVGGKHARTYLWCMTLSVMCFLFSVYIFMNVKVSLVSIAYFLWLIYVLKYGVMESKNRRKMTKKEKNIRQVKTIVFTILMYAVLIKASAKYFRIGAGILLFQISAVTAERIIILWKKKKSKRKLSSF